MIIWLWFKYIFFYFFIFQATNKNKKKYVRIMSNQLVLLGEMTTIVADTGDIETIRRLQPTDATTNPSLILKAALMPEYKYLLDAAISLEGTQKMDVDLVMDRIAVYFGAEIVKIVPGFVSTEIDARLSFDTEATVFRARRIIQMYQDLGIPKSRILIKIASTWEGIRAAEILEKEGIQCNLTLLFSLIQAAACAEAGVTLISPFVGRIYDWYKKETGCFYEDADNDDPGVQSVKSIFGYYKKFGYKTIIMGASFRSKKQILALAGCDRLTISPSLLDELQNRREEETVVRKLDAEDDKHYKLAGEKLDASEPSFRKILNEDRMATEKLDEGIQGFSKDLEKLEHLVLSFLSLMKTQ